MQHPCSCCKKVVRLKGLLIVTWLVAPVAWVLGLAAVGLIIVPTAECFRAKQPIVTAQKGPPTHANSAQPRKSGTAAKIDFELQRITMHEFWRSAPTDPEAIMSLADDVFNLPQDGVLYVDDHLHRSTSKAEVGKRHIALPRVQLPHELRRAAILEAIFGAINAFVREELRLRTLKQQVPVVWLTTGEVNHEAAKRSDVSTILGEA
jgi:hypothetical protein